jgi:pyrroloquinoline quinone biosynthesis protein B
LITAACTSANRSEKIESTIQAPTLVVLGNVQDAGSPHMACTKDCCKALFDVPDPSRKVVSLGVLDPENGKKFLFEATPDFTSQSKLLKQFLPEESSEVPDGIFLTHAHIGHYSGLMFLGKEAMNANKVSVYAMPRMTGYLKENGPWSQLVSTGNISLQPIKDQQAVTLTSNVRVEPFLVPHRDEFSETVGYKIIGPNKSALFIPDIDKWEKWGTSIIDEIKRVDYAFIDATFFDAAEVNHRDISEIPHPFVIESMKLFEPLELSERQKVWFIHFNHTNPLLDPKSDQSQQVHSAGFNIARFKDTFAL